MRNMLSTKLLCPIFVVFEAYIGVKGNKTPCNGSSSHRWCKTSLNSKNSYNYP
ncbi:hypothetical protein M758_UG034900 [Ceratodon purpureus]|nr:hypothetical protein M758_UG034900 [Ceratodon purpureus]